MDQIAESSTAHLHRLSPSESLSKQHDEDAGMWKEEEDDLEEFTSLLPTYLSLHSQTSTQLSLLNDLSNFLSTFQTDLSEAEGQIGELQERSKEIDRRLRDRETISQPLNTLISSLLLPPPLIALFRDTSPGDAWLPAIVELEEKIVNVKARGNVKAAHDVAMVVEGLKAKAIISLRSFLLNLLKPLRSSVRTNIQIIQSSILLKYLPFFRFLQRQAPKVAGEIQRGYVAAARSYYETCFRRYARALGVIKARTTEKRDLVGIVPAVDPTSAATARKTGKAREGTYSRLKYSRIEGEAVTLAYMADDKEFKQPVEALFRSLLLVLMDNASAEFTFIVRFFSTTSINPDRRGSSHTPSEAGLATPPMRRMSRKESSTSVLSLNQLLDQSVTPMDSISEYGGEDDEGESRLSRSDHRPQKTLSKDATESLTIIWKQVMDPGLEYCQAFFDSIADRLAPPPAIPLLSMIRLNDAVLAELDDRGCIPLESVCMTLKLSLWPLFQKEMDAHVESLKKLTGAAVGGGLGSVLGRTGPKDETVQQVAGKYAVLFSSMVALTEQEDQMLFSSLIRLRTELQGLIKQQASKIKVPQQAATFLANCYGAVISEVEQGDLAQPHVRQEIAYWEARRKGP